MEFAGTFMVECPSVVKCAGTSITLAVMCVGTISGLVVKGTGTF